VTSPILSGSDFVPNVRDSLVGCGTFRRRRRVLELRYQQLLKRPKIFVFIQEWKLCNHLTQADQKLEVSVIRDANLFFDQFNFILILILEALRFVQVLIKVDLKPILLIMSL
jgi:hypothetical protein